MVCAEYVILLHYFIFFSVIHRPLYDVKVIFVESAFFSHIAAPIWVTIHWIQDICQLYSL